LGNSCLRFEDVYAEKTDFLGIWNIEQNINPLLYHIGLWEKGGELGNWWEWGRGVSYWGCWFFGGFVIDYFFVWRIDTVFDDKIISMVFYFFCWKSFICSLGLLEVISLFCS
jgi:hypothetical protein